MNRLVDLWTKPRVQLSALDELLMALSVVATFAVCGAIYVAAAAVQERARRK